VAALDRYLRAAPAEDAAWAIYLLMGRGGRRAVSTRRLREWAAEWAALPLWLVESSYHAVGDLAETLALLCARGEGGAPVALSLAAWMEGEVGELGREDEGSQRERLRRWWAALDEPSCFVVHKLLTGAFRVGVSATLVARAVAAVAGCEPARVTHRLMGRWHPSATFASRLFAPDDVGGDRSRPYPFFLASPLLETASGDPRDAAHEMHTALGDRADWMAEWKWDGIRVQLVVRDGEVFVWSRGEELLTERLPEVTTAARALPSGTVIDGELVAWRGDTVLPFARLQRRIGRTSLSARVLRDAPVVLLAFDLLEEGGVDVRERPQRERRARLEALLAPAVPARAGVRDTAEEAARDAPVEPVAPVAPMAPVARERVLRLSPLVDAPSWEALAAARATSRSRGVEGVMLKRAGAPYRVGRVRGDWWKWKVSPHTVDAVLVYAQAGHGRRASLHTDYTFAVWDGDALVPVAKAYSGLTDDEIVEVDAWVRTHTLQRFGPVRAVPPQHVFELGFEGIQASTRHKAGVALRFPRILRWRRDKGAREASTLAELRSLARESQAEHPGTRGASRATPDEPSLFDVVADGE
jgi:DNA ligase 1